LTTPIAAVAALTVASKVRLAQNRDFCLPTPPAFDAPVKPATHEPTLSADNVGSCVAGFRGGGGLPSEYYRAVWYGKTRMAWLPDGEKILKISLFVLTQLTNVTDTQTPHDG